MKPAVLCLFLLAGLSFAAAGAVSTESFSVDVTNAYAQAALDTESFTIDVTNPYTQQAEDSETFVVDVTSLGFDYPVILGLALPESVNYLSQALDISANITSMYSSGISSVTADVTGCGVGVAALSLQSGVCSSSCIYTGSFNPAQSGTCEVTVNATDLNGKSGYAQASAVSSNEEYTFTSTTSQDGIALISITELPGSSSTVLIRAGGSTKTASIQTSASSLYINVLVKLGKAPASGKKITGTVI